MAEVIEHWPSSRKPEVATFEYPWDQWMDLDGNGHGDIWLATIGIDFPVTSSPSRMRSLMKNRAARVTTMREKKAPETLKPVKVKNTRTGEISTRVKRVKDFKPIRVKVMVVSDTQVAFQFYDSPEPPPEPQVVRQAVPKRRQPMRRRVPSSIQKTSPARELVSA